MQLRWTPESMSFMLVVEMARYTLLPLMLKAPPATMGCISLVHCQITGLWILLCFVCDNINVLSYAECLVFFLEGYFDDILPWRRLPWSSVVDCYLLDDPWWFCSNLLRHHTDLYHMMHNFMGVIISFVTIAYSKIAFAWFWIFKNVPQSFSSCNSYSRMFCSYVYYFLSVPCAFAK